jgi:hypothetical protein
VRENKKMKRALGCVSGIAFALVGLLQIVAVADGIEHWLGWHSLLGYLVCWVVALFVGGWPIIGTALGMLGAHYAWGWSWLSAVFLFWGLALVVMALSAVAGGIAAIVDRFKRAVVKRGPVKPK